jgi:hypothetical protein
MLGTDDILSRLQTKLDAGEIQKKDIAELLKIGNSRVTEIFDGRRKLKLDEAHNLVEHFNLEDPSWVLNQVVTKPVLRLLVRYLAEELGRSLEGKDQELERLSQDAGAFLRYVADPKVRDDIRMAEAFFLVRDSIDSKAS